MRGHWQATAAKSFHLGRETRARVFCRSRASTDLRPERSPHSNRLPSAQNPAQRAARPMVEHGTRGPEPIPDPRANRCGPRCGSPVVAQAAIPFLRAFIGGEKRHAYLLACENVGDQRRHGHMASIEGQIERLFTVFLGTSAGYKNARSYKIYSKTNSQRHSPARRRRSHTIANQRGACCNVHTPWGDLPTVTCRTTFLASVSTTESLRAQRELT